MLLTESIRVVSMDKVLSLTGLGIFRNRSWLVFLLVQACHSY